MARLILAGKNGLMGYFSRYDRRDLERLGMQGWWRNSHIVDMSAVLKRIIDTAHQDGEVVTPQFIETVLRRLFPIGSTTQHADGKKPKKHTRRRRSRRRRSRRRKTRHRRSRHKKTKQRR